MICPGCGTETTEDIKLCDNCRGNLACAEKEQALQTKRKTGISTEVFDAIGGIACGVLGLILHDLLFLGIILGGIAVVNGFKAQKHEKAVAIGTACIIVGFASAIFSVVGMFNIFDFR